METICVYRRSAPASLAADIMRQLGITARVRTAEPESHHRLPPVFILETWDSEPEAYLDRIVAASRDESDLVRDAVRCPECGSLRVEFPEHPKRSPSMRSVGYLVDRVGEWLHLGAPAFGCRDCHHIWKHQASAGTRGRSPVVTTEAA